MKVGLGVHHIHQGRDFRADMLIIIFRGQVRAGLVHGLFIGKKRSPAFLIQPQDIFILGKAVVFRLFFFIDYVRGEERLPARFC